MGWPRVIKLLAQERVFSLEILLLSVDNIRKSNIPHCTQNYLNRNLIWNQSVVTSEIAAGVYKIEISDNKEVVWGLQQLEIRRATYGLNFSLLCKTNWKHLAHYMGIKDWYSLGNTWKNLSGRESGLTLACWKRKPKLFWMRAAEKLEVSWVYATILVWCMKASRMISSTLKGSKSKAPNIDFTSFSYTEYS